MSVTKVDKEEYESCHQEEHVSGPMTSYSPGKVEDFEQPFVEILFDISNIQQIYTKCNTLIIWYNIQNIIIGGVFDEVLVRTRYYDPVLKRSQLLSIHFCNFFSYFCFSFQVSNLHFAGPSRKIRRQIHDGELVDKRTLTPSVRVRLSGFLTLMYLS